MNRIAFYWKLLLGLPKSLYVNFYYFGVKGIRLPILLTWRTRLTAVKGSIKINLPLKKGIVRIGFSGVAMSTFKQWNSWNVNGEIIFEGTANFGTGMKLFVGPHGKLTIGDNFLMTANSELCCCHSVDIGKNVLFSWDILLMDTDSHPIRNNQLQIINKDKPIVIGNNVWIGCRSTILKGSKIKDNSVVAVGSLTHRTYNKSNVIIGGVPASILMTDIVWNGGSF